MAPSFVCLFWGIFLIFFFSVFGFRTESSDRLVNTARPVSGRRVRVLLCTSEERSRARRLMSARFITHRQEGCALVTSLSGGKEAAGSDACVC